MSDENIQDSPVLGDCDVGTIESAGSGVDGSVSNSGTSEQLTPAVAESEALYPTEAELQANPRLRPDVPVEDIPGLDKQTAIDLGLLKSDEEYAEAERQALAAAEAYDHDDALSVATESLVHHVRASLLAVNVVADAVNQSYSKFVAVSMKQEADNLLALQGNLHFNAIIESLQEVKARAILLNVELTNL